MKQLLTLTMCLVSLFVNAQITYVGRVLDANKQPLAGATIQSKLNKNTAVVTGVNGNFSITLQDTNTVIVKYIGFTTLEKTLSTSKNNIILQENDELLNEVVISASRELQKRKEVPAAITAITSKDIEDAKAFGLDQLVNDVPGVYLSTSRSSSNEQHFTALRSPISTKPLFLFLEDGLPLRPTAIFNHNALLELNTIAHKRVEVLRGPNASIYGSDAIGGSFNFITKDPTQDLTGHLSYQLNDVGFSSVTFDASKQITDKFGLYIASQFNQRNNGPIAHSDYDKYALNVKAVFKPLKKSKLTLYYAGTDFLSDMAGSISAQNFEEGNFESDQTFTNRDAVSSRLRATWDQNWNANNKTSFSALYRHNVMKQNPSFRISPERVRGVRTGRVLGELNNNTFNSYFGNIQHLMKFPNIKASLILGGTLDITTQDYVANRTLVNQDANTGLNLSFEVLEDDFILNYLADIDNYAGYTQFEIEPIERVKFTLGARYDYFKYTLNNRIQNGIENREDSWSNIAPKVGVNYNVSNNVGLYANYSTGFTPPQSSTLYRNLSNTNVNGELQPSNYNNFEIGTYLALGKQLKLDVALYRLDGKNTLVSVRNEENADAFITTNAGKTSSYGIEYGVSYKPTSLVEISHNGTYAKHKYDTFSTVVRSRSGSEFRDFSNTDREIAPNIIGTTKIKFKPVNCFTFTLSHEIIGEYNTAFEGLIVDDNGLNSTPTYRGHNIFNLTFNYTVKKVDLWMHALNVFNTNYANRVSFNTFSNANTFTVGNPRAFHFGAKYKF